jgi:hypothetical protein
MLAKREPEIADSVPPLSSGKWPLSNSGLGPVGWAGPRLDHQPLSASYWDSGLNKE